MKSFRRSIKAVSPVIATIIIVAIAIVMSIAVAYWLLGPGSSFTKYEKIEVSSAYAVLDDNDTPLDPSDDFFLLTMDLKNTGSATATIDSSYILYNGKPATGYTDAPVPAGLDVTLEPGKVAQGTITFPKVADGDWSAGMTVEVMLHTVAGKDYPKVITLP